MRRIKGVAALGLVASSLGFSGRASAEPPPLLPPPQEAPADGSAPVLPPALEPTPTAESAAGPSSGPMQIIPGLTVPRPRQAAAPALKPADGLPPLVGPAEMPPLASPIRSEDELGPLDPLPKRPGTALRPGEPPDETPARRTRPESPTPRPAPVPRRPPGLLGRIFPPGGTSRGVATARRDGVSVEPKTDPSADSALKRRIEREVRESLGGRVQSADVSVAGRDVTIRAHPTHFWQRRSVRHALEHLPSTAGATLRVDLKD